MPTRLKVLRGNPGQYRLPTDNEPQPIVPIAIPGPPEFLTGYARDEWHRIAVELHRLQLLTAVDINPLAAYCSAYKRWRTAEETIVEMAKRDPVTHALVISHKQKGPVINPLVRIAANAAADMVRYAAEFGLSPAARARIAAGPFSENRPTKFGNLIAG